MVVVFLCILLLLKSRYADRVAAEVVLAQRLVLDEGRHQNASATLRKGAI